MMDRYDGLLVDLDGVVYRGDRAIPGAADALTEVRRRGTPVVFLTNNSTMTPEEVAAEARLQQIPSLEGVRWAVLESNGKISFIPR